MAWKRRTKQPFYYRFWEKIDIRGPDECWPWLACRNSRGCGLIRLSSEDESKMQLATRVMMVMKTGKPIPPSLVVMHSCDNPICVNPAHLSLGTFAENMADMAAKGRGRGRTLARKDIQAICALLDDGVERKGIAGLFEVSESTVADIACGATWNWLTYRRAST